MESLMTEGVCKLCLKTAPLLDSHYLPRRVYSMNMARSLKNPNPVTLAHGQAKQVSDQLRGHTFCIDCEDRLNKNGEKWVLTNVADDYKKPFSLQEAVIPEQPYFGNESLNVYAGREIAAFNMDQLIYFGMSIFWRGAAREWKSSTGAIAPPVDLGSHFEPIRQFLLGGPFPPNVCIVMFVHNLKPVPNAALPVQRGKNEYGDFNWFYVNGLGFQLYLGDSVPLPVRNVCAFSNPRGPVVVDRGFGQMVYDFIKTQLDTSTQSDGLTKFLSNYKTNFENQKNKS
jgi:hypothetical protein